MRGNGLERQYRDRGVQDHRQGNALVPIEPFSASPLMLVEQHGTQLGQLGRRILERGEQDGAFADRERDQLDAVDHGAVEAVGQVVSADNPDEFWRAPRRRRQGRVGRRASRPAPNGVPPPPVPRWAAGGFPLEQLATAGTPRVVGDEANDISPEPGHT